MSDKQEQNYGRTQICQKLLHKYQIPMTIRRNYLGAADFLVLLIKVHTAVIPDELPLIYVDYMTHQCD